jgi:hypothetical protein
MCPMGALQDTLIKGSGAIWRGLRPAPGEGRQVWEGEKAQCSYSYQAAVSHRLVEGQG